MEYIPGEPLSYWIHSNAYFAEADIRLIAAQLLLTVDFLSSLNVVHCDIKPQNILLNKNPSGSAARRGPKNLIIGDLVLVDFSYSTNIQDALKAAEEGKDSTHGESKKQIKPKKTLSSVNGTPGYIPPEIL